jgi:hypothetical protein
MLAALMTFIFYVSAGLLCFVCVVVANSMERDTCPCMKFCLFLIILGATVQAVMAWYELISIYSMVPNAAIGFGISSWLLIDRRSGHLKVDLIIFNIKHWFKYKALARLGLTR